MGVGLVNVRLTGRKQKKKPTTTNVVVVVATAVVDGAHCMHN